MKRIRFVYFISAFILVSTSCKKSTETATDILFSLEDDKKLGQQTADQIAADPATYPLLSESQYPAAYSHILRIRDNILNSGKVAHKNDFVWQVKIIKNDSVLNAFCTPGGYIYVYTGIIKYLDNEAQLAGVLGHEIAHADRRHSVQQMTEQYGLSVLLSIVAGNNPGMLTQLVANLTVLKFSRAHETEADEYSVIYLYPTDYDARGAKYFFEKIEAQGGSSTPAFLSTHPDPGDRVTNINKKWQDMGGKVGQTFESRYQDFKSSLP
jgi:predicted Zn-dependent protease